MEAADERGSEVPSVRRGRRQQREAAITCRGDRRRRVGDRRSFLVAEDDGAGRPVGAESGGPVGGAGTVGEGDRGAAGLRRQLGRTGGQLEGRPRRRAAGELGEEEDVGAHQISFLAASQSAIFVAASAAGRFSIRSVGPLASGGRASVTRGQRATAELVGGEAEIGKRPGLEWLPFCGHDALQARVSRLANLVRHARDDGKRRADPVESGGTQPADPRLAIGEGQLRPVRQERDVAHRRHRPGHERAARVVGGHPHQSDVRRELVERGGQDPGGDPLVRARQGVIGHEHGIVAAHGQRATQGLGGRGRPHRQVSDRVGGSGVEEAQGLLDGVLVERIDDGLDARAVEAQVIGVALVGAGGRDLLDS